MPAERPAPPAHVEAVDLLQVLRETRAKLDLSRPPEWTEPSGFKTNHPLAVLVSVQTVQSAGVIGANRPFIAVC